MQSEILIQGLIQQTKDIINQAENLKGLTDDQLNHKTNSETWSVLECVEHLNRYCEFYFKEINQSARKMSISSDENFKSGWLGNYFANSMLPKEKSNKMKTFKAMNPTNSELNKKVIDKFIQYQITQIEMLNQARKYNLNKVKVKTTISSLIKINLGDCYRFLINHNLRHFSQINRILSASK